MGSVNTRDSFSRHFNRAMDKLGHKKTIKIIMILLMMFCFAYCRDNIIGTETNPNEFWTCVIINIKCNPATNIQTTTERCTNPFGDERLNYYTIECP